MRLHTHLATSSLLAAALYRRAPLRAALLIAGGVLLDTDHYLLYALRSGNWNPLAALRYDGWRHAPLATADTRQRYGSLRSIFHRAWLTLPLVWGISARCRALRPFALGVTLHLVLDAPFMQLDWRVWRRAGDRCERCSARGRDHRVIYIVPPRHGGARWALGNRAAWCRPCVRAVYG